jgi:hypothetical protein
LNQKKKSRRCQGLAFDPCLDSSIPRSSSSPGLPVSCGDIGFKKTLGLVLARKTGLKVPLLPLGGSCPLQTILLSDLVGFDSPLQIVKAVWCTIIGSKGLSHPTQKAQIQTKRAPNCHYYLQRAVIPNWKDSIAL